MKTNKVIKKQIAKKIGNAIKFYRSKLNLSQEQLADKVGVDKTYIGALEQGVKCASVYCLYFISKELNIPFKELFDINLENYKK